MRTYAMRTQLMVGKQGVSIVQALYEMMGASYIQDVQNDRDYQTQDIDLVAHYDDADGDEPERIEVKYDRYHTGNFFLELAYTDGRPGCAMATQADTWAYVLPAYRRVYLIEVQPLQDWLRDHRWDYPPKTVRSSWGAGDKRTWEVYGIAVPFEDITAAVPYVAWEY